MPSSCPPGPKTKSSRRAFTVLEVVVTVAILLIILIALVQAMDSADRAWKAGGSDPYAAARDAFETVASRLADATLETYQDYADASGAFRTNASFVPDHLARRSDLAFVCGPAGGTNGLLASSQRVTADSAVFFTATEGSTQNYANQGLEHLLNAMGYFVEFSDDDSEPAFLLGFAHRYRWRLRQIEQPAEALQVYAATTSPTWIQQLVPSGTVVPMLAENVVALVVLPERLASDSGPALSPAYRYDSRDATNPITLNQLPPRLRLAMVAIDTTSADRLAAQNGANAPQLVAPALFQQSIPPQLDQDLATLDATLTAQKIGHRIFQREIQLTSSAWSNSVTP
jgi:uncharacterized protein (TIGR02599 family)